MTTGMEGNDVVITRTVLYCSYYMYSGSPSRSDHAPQSHLDATSVMLQ